MLFRSTEAAHALEAARALFAGGLASENVPTTEWTKDKFEAGLPLLDLLIELGLTPSKAEGKRLIQQNGLALSEVTVTDFGKVITLDDFNENQLMIRKGKKVFHRIQLV